MFEFLSGISVPCFVTSYLVAFSLELSRLWIHIPLRRWAIAGSTITGLTLHLLFLVLRAIPVDNEVQTGLLSGWYDWSLLLAWGLAACYLFLFFSHSKTSLGYFLLPPTMGLILLALFSRDWAPFSREDATGIWRNVHALAMLIGAVAVLLGFLAGIMYLIQASKLKHKRAGSGRLRLPTLEWLQMLNRRCLFFSTAALGIGLLSGIIMNLNRWGFVHWSERGILFSGILLLWLVAASLFEWYYKPVRQGHKVVYLTLASFGFLILAMIGVLSSPHGRSPTDPSSPTQPITNDSLAANPNFFGGQR